MLTGAARGWPQLDVDRPWVAWCLARVGALAVGGLAVAVLRGNVFFDTSYYAHWAHGSVTGTQVPYRDFRWEYPPGALPAMVLPALIATALHAGHGGPYPWVYGVAWIALMLAVDAAVLRWLLKCTNGLPRHPATVVWVWGAPLLGALTWSRFDLLPAAAAALAIVASGAGSSWASGWWAGVGVSLKGWPLLLAPVQRDRRRTAAGLAGMATIVATVAAATFRLTGSPGFDQVVSNQAQRGLQCEALAALPVLWLRHMHVGGYAMTWRFGAWEVAGPHIGLLACTATVIYGLGLIGLGWTHWRCMRRGAGARRVALTAMALMLLTLVTDKVFSPQYLLWLLAALSAACILDAPRWRPFVPWVLVVCALTALEFPWFYGDVLGTSWFGLLALTARDLVLLGISGAVARELVQRQPTDVSDAGIWAGALRRVAAPESLARRPGRTP